LPLQVLINLFIAFLWMFLQDEWSFLAFFSGYLVGIVVLFILRRFYKQEFYLSKLGSIIKLFLVFIRELITSSIFVVGHIIRPKVSLTPGIIAVETDLEGDLEVTIFSLLLNLTPGSVVIEVSSDAKVFYIHALDLPKAGESVRKASKIFEKAIKDVTRK